MDRREYNRKYYNKHREHIISLVMNNQKKHHERTRAIDKKWRDNHRDQKHDIDKNYYRNNRQRIIDRVRKYREENKEKIREYRKTKIRFGDKQISVGRKLRTGQCSRCKKIVGVDDIKVTNMHHMQYDINDPSAYTVELCVPCHSQVHILDKIASTFR